MFIHRYGKLTLDLGGEPVYCFASHPFDNRNYLIQWGEEHQLRPGQALLDIGANVGSWTLHYAASQKCSHVYAWEPQRGTRNCIMAALYLNDLADKVTVFADALGDTPGEATLHVAHEDGGASSLDATVGPDGPKGPWQWIRDERVQVRTLDSYGLTNIGLVKVDVESHEEQVLRGGVETLKANGYPPIFFEAWSWPWYIQRKASLFEFIESLGYKIHHIVDRTDDFLAVHP